MTNNKKQNHRRKKTNEKNKQQKNIEKKEAPKLVIPEDSFVLVPLGGVTEIGLNFFLYGYQGKWLIVDCGLGFPGDDFPGVDLLVPDPSFIAQQRKNIVGMVVTHGHEDHIGSIPYLWKDLQCPIFATPFTAELIEGKLEEANLLKRAELNVVEQGALLELDPFEVEFIPVNHSIPEPSMLAIRTKEGTVIHTGDWKFDNAPIIGEKTDTKILQKLGKEGVLALVSDSTNIFSEKEEHSERDVRKSLTEIFKESPSRIIITCFASNVGRVESIYWAAKESGRHVCLMGRSLWRIDDAARASGYMEDIPPYLTEEEASDYPPEKLVYICTGSQGEPYSALSKIASPHPMPGQLHLNAKDIVIFSSRVIPGNEQSINVLQKRLLQSGCKIITDREKLVHVSGHPAQDSMKKLYQYLKPKIAVPVHGEPMHIVEHKRLAEEWGAGISIIIEEGDVLELNNGEPEVLGEVPVGCLAVDGKKIIGLTSNVLKKRQKMIEGGTIVGTVVVGKKGNVLGEPQVSAFGLMDTAPQDQRKLVALIKSNVQQLPAEHRKDDEKICEEIRMTVRRFISEQYGKKPLIEIHLVRV